jgi:purine-binding chemotaxis protein CheW
LYLPYYFIQENLKFLHASPGPIGRDLTPVLRRQETDARRGQSEAPSVMSDLAVSSAVGSPQRGAVDPGMAIPPSAAAAPTQLISFAIGDDQYGVDIMAVREIKGWTAITHLPRQPDYVRGVLNLRGVIVPIIDLRCRFGQGMTEATPLHIVIIVQVASKLVGLLADRVLDIVSLDGLQIQPVPRVVQSSRVEFLAGLVTIEGAMIALIDLPHLLSMPANTLDGSRSSH